MTPLCALLVNYNTEPEIPWVKRSATNDPIDPADPGGLGDPNVAPLILWVLPGGLS